MASGTFVGFKYSSMGESNLRLDVLRQQHTCRRGCPPITQPHGMLLAYHTQMNSWGCYQVLVHTVSCECSALHAELNRSLLGICTDTTQWWHHICQCIFRIPSKHGALACLFSQHLSHKVVMAESQCLRWCGPWFWGQSFVPNNSTVLAVAAQLPGKLPPVRA
jgi:hypothetical protein